MDARSLIAKVRDSKPLARSEAVWFANGLADGTVTDAQAGAFAMAALLNGLGEQGRIAFTEAMRDSGDRMAWDLPGPAIDKHSTGGIGDTVSLLLAPMLAASGAYVPMISGRGLGHTGGTLDKLEAIPGVNTSVTPEDFHDLVRGHGAAIVAATGDLAPADRRLYAIRDVTSTVESIDLITASILSKKLAAGLDALILDVKVGSGAFLPEQDAAEKLARSLVDTANGAGCTTAALITDMSQPLAAAAGNALEVRVALEALTGAVPHDRLVDLSVVLSARLATLAGLDLTEATLRNTLSDGSAAEVFEKMMNALGGPSDLLSNYRARLPRAPVVVPVAAPMSGCVSAIDGRAVGEAAVHLGAGRLRGDDLVDPAVGLDRLLPIGTKVAIGDPIAEVHAADEGAAKAASTALEAAYRFSDGPVDPAPLVLGEVL